MGDETINNIDALEVKIHGLTASFRVPVAVVGFYHHFLCLPIPIYWDFYLVVQDALFFQLKPKSDLNILILVSQWIRKNNPVGFQ